MKGIILAGGNGSRLHPLTLIQTKQLLPVFDKPMIYYPLSTLLLLGITEIYIICKPNSVLDFESLLGDGTDLGIKIHFIEQSKPRGIVDAFLLTKSVIDEDVCLILGDNFFHGNELIKKLRTYIKGLNGALICGYRVKNPGEFGVVEFDKDYNVLSVEEKPANPKSKFAIPGIYFYDKSVFDFALEVVPSMRGELEITDLNKIYMGRNKLSAIPLGRGTVWLDTGNPDALLSASEYVSVIQKRQGLHIACIEEISWRMGNITLEDLEIFGKRFSNSDYGKYLLEIVESERINFHE
jgi:glucose-1-phosphate thymidylyltransferase